MGFVKTAEELERYYALGVREFPDATMVGVIFTADAELTARPALLRPGTAPHLRLQPQGGAARLQGGRATRPRLRDGVDDGDDADQKPDQVHGQRAVVGRAQPGNEVGDALGEDFVDVEGPASGERVRRSPSTKMRSSPGSARLWPKKA